MVTDRARNNGHITSLQIKFYKGSHCRDYFSLCCFLLNCSHHPRPSCCEDHTPPTHTPTASPPVAGHSHPCTCTVAFISLHSFPGRALGQPGILSSVQTAAHCRCTQSYLSEQMSSVVPHSCWPHTTMLFAGSCTPEDHSRWFWGLCWPVIPSVSSIAQFFPFRVNQDVYPVSLALERSHTEAWKAESWAL